MSSGDELWFGFSREHGWVILDRTWPGNRPGDRTGLAFVKCSDWTIVEIPFLQWDEPAFTFVDRLPDADRPSARKQTEYRRAYGHRRASLTKKRVELLHRRAMPKSTGPAPRLRVADGSPRTANCWKCSRGLDSSIHYQCSRCGWIVCWLCGACGCGYPFEYRRGFAPKMP